MTNCETRRDPLSFSLAPPPPGAATNFDPGVDKVRCWEPYETKVMELCAVYNPDRLEHRFKEKSACRNGADECGCDGALGNQHGDKPSALGTRTCVSEGPGDGGANRLGFRGVLGVSEPMRRNYAATNWDKPLYDANFIPFCRLGHIIITPH